MVRQIVRTLIDDMQAQPLALGLIVINIVFLIVLVWVLREVAVSNRQRADQQHALIQELQKACPR